MLPPEPAVRELNCGKPIAVRPEVESENNDFTAYAATAIRESLEGTTRGIEAAALSEIDRGKPASRIRIA